MRMTEVEKVYGQSLYDLARDKGLAPQFREELAAVRKIFSEEPHYLQLLSAPNLSKQERCRMLDDAFRGKIHIFILNFLKILTERGYIRRFPGCCDVFSDLYNLDNGILPVTAVTAVPLREDQAKRLVQKLQKITGKTIELENRLDRSIYGGVRLDYDGQRLEDTVSHRLDAIRDLLNKTVL